MTTGDILSPTAQRLVAFLRERVPTAGVTIDASTPLFSSRLIDSMMLIELLAFVEQELGAVLEGAGDVLAALDTPAGLARHIDELKAHARR